MLELLAGRAVFPAAFVGSGLEQLGVKAGHAVISHATHTPMYHSVDKRSRVLTESNPLHGARGRNAATIERMFDGMDQLNEAQLAAVTHEGGPLRVLAGAGTGKTTALSARVAWLLANGTPPERLLLLTFTRRAARQMLHRTGVMLAGAATRLHVGSGAPAE